MDPKEAADKMLRYIEGNATPEDMADLLIPPPAVDLRHVPPADWINLVGAELKLPDDVQTFVDGQKTFTQAELDAIEDRVTAYYEVKHPFYVTAATSPTFSVSLGHDPKNLLNA